MNNISYPEGWGKSERKYEEIHWHLSFIREPEQKDVYLVTIHVEGIIDTVISAEWLGDMWNCEHIGDVVAWATMPKPYEQAK